MHHIYCMHIESAKSRPKKSLSIDIAPIFSSFSINFSEPLILYVDTHKDLDRELLDNSRNTQRSGERRTPNVYLLMCSREKRGGSNRQIWNNIVF